MLWDDPEFLRHYDNRGGLNRPNAMILSYPVLLSDKDTHEESLRNVSGCAPGTPGYEYFGLDRHVGPGTPPTFLWHTAEDDCVPVENTLRFALALSAHKVPFEAHIFPFGGHGLSTCTEETCGAPVPDDARWLPLALDWLSSTFGFTL